MKSLQSAVSLGGQRGCSYICWCHCDLTAVYMKHEMNYNLCDINPFDQLMVQSVDCDNENDLRARI